MRGLGPSPTHVKDCDNICWHLTTFAALRINICQNLSTIFVSLPVKYLPLLLTHPRQTIILCLTAHGLEHTTHQYALCCSSKLFPSEVFGWNTIWGNTLCPSSKLFGDTNILVNFHIIKIGLFCRAQNNCTQIFWIKYFCYFSATLFQFLETVSFFSLSRMRTLETNLAFEDNTLMYP